MSTEGLVRRPGACTNARCRHVTCWQVRVGVPSSPSATAACEPASRPANAKGQAATCRGCGKPLPPTRLPVDCCSGACHVQVHGPGRPDDPAELLALTETNGGETPVAPGTTKHPDLVTHHEENP